MSESDEERDEELAHNELLEEQDREDEEHEIEVLLKFINNDFLGFFKGKSLEIKKMKALEIYRYFFRFCTEKMEEFIESPVLLLLTMQYLSKTQMKRIHQREVLSKNEKAYYSAVENIINLSPYREILLGCMPLILQEHLYEI